MTLPLVLLPGMMCDARIFGPQIAALSAARDVTCAKLSMADSIAEMARSVLRNAPPTFALAGLSMGGIVAMEVLRQGPARVTRLALLDTNPLAEDEAVRAGRARQIARADAGDLDEMMADTFIPRYVAARGTTLKVRQRIEILCREMATDLGPEVFVRQSRALRDRPDQCATLRSFDGPALILCGAEDTLCPPDRHVLMAQLMPQAQLRMVPEAGHLPTLEKPQQTTEALRQWLS